MRDALFRLRDNGLLKDEIVTDTLKLAKRNSRRGGQRTLNDGEVIGIMLKIASNVLEKITNNFMKGISNRL